MRQQVGACIYWRLVSASVRKKKYTTLLLGIYRTRMHLCRRERNCADTIGTVLVPWAGHFQQQQTSPKPPPCTVRQGSFPVRKRTGTLRIWRAREREHISGSGGGAPSGVQGQSPWSAGAKPPEAEGILLPKRANLSLSYK